MNYKKRQEWFSKKEQTLASVTRRLLAMLIDIAVVAFLFYLVILIFRLLGYEITTITWENLGHVELKVLNMNEESIHYLTIFMAFIPTLYFAITTYITNGQSLGKKIMGIRIVSLYHHKIGLWHCIERSLGYVASTLEMGLGFIQVYWNPNKMTLHDRIAETIVIRNNATKNAKPNIIRSK